MQRAFIRENCWKGLLCGTAAKRHAVHARHFDTVGFSLSRVEGQNRGQADVEFGGRLLQQVQAISDSFQALLTFIVKRASYITAIVSK